MTRSVCMEFVYYWFSTLKSEIMWAAGMCLAFGLLEFLIPTSVRKGLSARLTNFRMFAVTLTALLAFGPIFAAIIMRLPTDGLLGLWLVGLKDDGWISVIAGALVYGVVWDFFQYWAHRLEHKNPILWKVHRVHHSDPHFNSSTALRQSIGGHVVGFFLISVPTLIVCGLNPVSAIVGIILFSGFGYWNHADIRLNLGPLTRVVSGPQWHRLHHGKAKTYHNCNYAAFFPFWDVLFGTYRAPEAMEYPETGVVDGRRFTLPEAEVFSPLFAKKIRGSGS